MYKGSTGPSWEGVCYESRAAQGGSGGSRVRRRRALEALADAETMYLQLQLMPDMLVESTVVARAKTTLEVRASKRHEYYYSFLKKSDVYLECCCRVELPARCIM
jgi:hypothetical protein